MQFSYWEYKQWFSNIDYCIVGSGIVGLSAALHLRKLYPKAKILVVERGMLPNGASTKNAGFACFGSISEILSDTKKLAEEEILTLVEKRLNGLRLLRNTLGDKTIGYQQHGGYELFFKSDESLYDNCMSAINQINHLLSPVLEEDVFHVVENKFGFENCFPKLIYNPFEAQIDTGSMMQALLKKAILEDILILNGVEVLNFEEHGEHVTVNTSSFNFTTHHLLIATNGLTKKLLQADLKPARAQVLLTEPILNLTIKGTFHIDEGYYYFRNIDNRILLGGARNLDFETEETTELELNEKLQTQLDKVLRETILPGKSIEVERRWTGIMGMGNTKQPIVKKLSDRVSLGVRLGGMGIAIGSLIGKELAEKVVLS